MASAREGNTVRVHYTGQLPDGTVFDSSAGREPLEFMIGSGTLIPGFERGVIGMEPGERRTTTIPADDAYGPRIEENVVVVERGGLPPGMDPRVGEHLELSGEDGEKVSVRVTETSEGSVTLDANHPLAGQDLVFEIELLDIS